MGPVYAKRVVKSGTETAEKRKSVVLRSRQEGCNGGGRVVEIGAEEG